MSSELLRNIAQTPEARDQVSRVGGRRWHTVLEEAEVGGKAGRDCGIEVQNNGPHVQHKSLYELYREVSERETVLTSKFNGVIQLIP